ncbi:MAG: response regulator [Clostridiales bacterium]|jgi:YesN/AraC family two-component response regulator|nr:response regulator [Clostridiales bacterium]
MYKLLVVDDNKRETRVLQEIISSLGLDIRVIGTAADGEEGLALVAELEPDIVLTDIYMPVMNGIEMIKVIVRERPEKKIVIISSYDDFSFAKSAIDLSTCGYILKPIQTEEIERTLRKVIGQCELERKRLLESERLARQLEQSMPLLREEFFRELLFSGPDGEESEIRDRMRFLQVPSAQFRNAAVIFMRRKEPAGGSGPRPRTARDTYLEYMAMTGGLRSLGAGTSGELGFTVEVVRNTNTEYLLLLFFDEPDTVRCQNLIMEFVMEACELLPSRLGLAGGPPAAVFGVSSISAMAKEIFRLRAEAEAAVNTKFYSNGSPVILYSEIEEPEDNPGDAAGGPGAFDFKDLLREMEESIFMGDSSSVESFVDKYIRAAPPSDGGLPQPGWEAYLKSLAYVIVNILLIKLEQKELGKSLNIADLSSPEIPAPEEALWRKLTGFETAADLRQWLKGLLCAVKKRIEARNNHRNASIADTIKQVVAERYMEPLNVADIARAVYLGPKQANAVFRKVMNCTIFDYVVNYRIEKAKQLLKNSDEKVVDVAENVGYANKSHFALMFKRITGMTPTEYKSKPVL